MANRRGKRGFGSIRTMPSKRYQASYVGPDTRRHFAPLTFDTKQDAEGWLGDERRLIAADTWTSPRDRAQVAIRQAAEEAQAQEAARAATFAVYARSWLASRHDLRQGTQDSYRTAIERHLIPTFGDTAVDGITAPMVRDWFASYGAKTPTARAHAYQVLGMILGRAEDDGLIGRSPARVKSGGRAKVQREPEVLTLPELLALADAMPEQHRVLTLLSGLTGLRFGEAVALRRRDVDLAKGIVHVRRTAVRGAGAMTTNAPKTAAGTRTVAMPAMLVDRLREHLKAQPVTGRDALVFPAADGGLLAPSSVYGNGARVEKRSGRKYTKAAYGFHAAREAIGRPSLIWHDLRRTAASIGAESGATVAEIQRRLGHATPTMALYYQRASEARDRDIADALQARIDALASSGNITPLPKAAEREA